MSEPVDLTGQTFGRLYVALFAGSEERSGRAIRVWHCICECGNLTRVTTPDLRSGDTTSCGCYKAEVFSAPGRARKSLKAMERGRRENLS